MSAETTEDLDEAFRVVNAFIDGLSSYDLLDRAEVLASLTFLARKRGIVLNELNLMLSEQLMALPIAVTGQLQQLGIL